MFLSIRESYRIASAAVFLRTDPGLQYRDKRGYRPRARAKNALRACGFGCDEDAGTSNAAGMARAIGTFWSSSVSNRARESALRFVERTILDLMGQIDEGEVPSRAAERRGTDPRWLRRSALELISRVPRRCADTDGDRTEWIVSFRQACMKSTAGNC